MRQLENPTVAVDAVAEALLAAFVTAQPTNPPRSSLGDSTEVAYAVQEAWIRRREQLGARRVGRKVGLTSPAVQRQLGVDEPDFGVLLDDMDATSFAAIPSSRLIQPRIEAEVAFILSQDIDSPERETIVGAVAEVAAALEIVDSRVRDWDISLVDTVADNASSAYFVLGDERRTLEEVRPRDVVMTLERDGVAASAGRGEECLGDPVDALVWVARTAHRLGRPLRAGEVILSGALGPMVPFGPGTTVTARISGLGSVSATAGKE